MCWSRSSASSRARVCVHSRSGSSPRTRTSAGKRRAGYRNSGAEAEETLSATFVGRTHERLRLLGRLGEVQGGSGRLALLSGEPGIGKTRLCEELSAHARSQHMQVVWARGWEGDGAPTFWPWVQVLRKLAEDTPADALATAIEGSGADIARVVPDYARFVTVADDAPDAESARFRFFEAVATLLRNLSTRQALVVVLDDLHWADQSSLRLLEFAVSALQSSSVFLVGTFREAEARTPTARQHARHPGARPRARATLTRRAQPRRGRRLRGGGRG